jgi:arginine/lysine/ornithine decarboxylase
MAIFGSTSPSYLILQSLDLCNKYIDEKIREDIERCANKLIEFQDLINDKYIASLSFEPLKFTIDFRGYVFDFVKHFRSHGIEFEYADDNFIVFMFSPQNSDEDFEKFKVALEQIEVKGLKDGEGIVIPHSKRVMTIREAIFSECEEIDVEEAVGRICASPTVSCPPAIPIAVSGDEITNEHIKLFKKYKIDKILVVK